MKTVMTAVALVATLTTASVVHAMDANALKGDAVTVVKSFGGPLKMALQEAMKKPQKSPPPPPQNPAGALGAQA